jgi:hypothetical protein
MAVEEPDYVPDEGWRLRAWLQAVKVTEPTPAGEVAAVHPEIAVVPVNTPDVDAEHAHRLDPELLVVTPAADE